MGDINLRDCLVYFDDIIIYSNTFQEHLSHLEAVFEWLLEQNLKLKASKCKFFRDQVLYLGHVVSQEGIQTDPAKIELSLGPFLNVQRSYANFLASLAIIVVSSRAMQR